MKWTITMTEEELHRKTIVEHAIAKRITQKEGAARLHTSEHNFRRILFWYRQNDDIGLVSKQRGKPSNHRLEDDKRQTIVEMMVDPQYSGFGSTLFSEKLEEYQGIVVSRETVRQLMIEKGRHHPKVKKKQVHLQRERRERRGN